MIHGVNPATFFFLPMLGKHPDEYPRFRDCFVEREDLPHFAYNIILLTRTGGDNREAYKEQNDAIRNMPDFVTDFDWDEDTTFAYWIFDVPAKWRQDYDAIKLSQAEEVSRAYKDEVYRVYPKIEQKLRALFNDKI